MIISSLIVAAIMVATHFFIYLTFHVKNTCQQADCMMDYIEGFPRDCYINHGRKPGHQTLLFLGDSLLAATGAGSFTSSLAYMIAIRWTNRAFRFVNMAKVKTTVSDLRAQLSVLPHLKGPVTAFVFMGCNNVTRFTSQEVFEFYLAGALRYLKNSGARIVIATLPEPSFMPALMGRGHFLAPQAEKLNESIRKLAATYGAQVVDLYPVKLNKPEYYAPDGYHLNDYGYAQLVYHFPNEND